ncbi:hypothetical protein CY34DRAFT_462137 [Suillus luteus UH-Slu-Lm8-n1]|uniref:Unplaced genomic scaffold CY34scaffold_325, whole genome shotgun sequence n=1 Tax=Suillus luteus UH-Slu-Lm8-n1 TaxID=930992 RepID=A0A0D0AGU2_9AGAM|nr:hypothetical protein CY34DRAFT_462137 [Suillus luteus UH-Slu-Lm8-n1]
MPLQASSSHSMTRHLREFSRTNASKLIDRHDIHYGDRCRITVRNMHPVSYPESLIISISRTTNKWLRRVCWGSDNCRQSGKTEKGTTIFLRLGD